MADRSRQKPDDWWKDPRVPDGYKPPDRGAGSREQDRPRLQRQPMPRQKPPQDQQQRQPSQPQPQPRRAGLMFGGEAQMVSAPVGPKPSWTGRGSVDATQEATKDPREFNRMMQGAFDAGRNGDTGALDSFPADTPMGRLLRREFQRGAASRGQDAQQQRTRERDAEQQRLQRRGLGLAGT